MYRCLCTDVLYITQRYSGISQCHVCCADRHLPSRISSGNSGGSKPSRHAGTQPSASIPRQGSAAADKCKHQSSRISHQPSQTGGKRCSLRSPRDLGDTQPSLPSPTLYLGRECRCSSGGHRPPSSCNSAAAAKFPLSGNTIFLFPSCC